MLRDAFTAARYARDAAYSGVRVDIIRATLTRMRQHEMISTITPFARAFDLLR